jgi:hypothetical protein
MLIPTIRGGLGNVMFELASVYSVAKQTGHSFGIYKLAKEQIAHASVDATETILRPWLQFQVGSRTESTPVEQFRDKDGYVPDIGILRNYSNSTHVMMEGYFQRQSLIAPHKDEVIALFDISGTSVEPNSYFLHVRRGDYVGNSFHEFNLNDYYRRAIAKFPQSATAHIVSNDIEWCRSWTALDDIHHTFVSSDEVTTLVHMAHCDLGGIAANSTFSWWGLYLNTNRPIMCMPNRFFPNTIMYQDDYVIPGVESMPI